MTLDALRTALDALPDPSFVEGKTPLSERFAIALPDGDVGALDDATFVTWLTAHAEDAPFGEGTVTKRDKEVRHAQRLVARGRATVTGFDPRAILPEIEAALSPLHHLDAQLEDVIVYPVGGKFARHKDTPRTAALVGTLVVGLPIAHEGGAFSITDAGTTHVVDWSGAQDPGAVRWVALFSDLDHAVETVTAGARVTLVYSLSHSERPRADAARDARLAKVRDAIAAIDIAKDVPLMIACTRQIVTDGTQPQPLDTLRGADREIAALFADAGYDVAVRACLAGDNEEGGTRTFPNREQLYSITRLAKAVPADVIAGMNDIVSFTDTVDLDEELEEDIGATLLGDYVLDATELDRWVIRKRAAASVIYEGMYSETGYFGNEASFGHLYSLAAIEIARR